MMWRSLRLRLAMAAALSISLAVVVAGAGLVSLFERHVVRRVDAELESTVRSLIAAVEIDGGGRLSLPRQPSDPRFEQVTSGQYWQVDGGRMGLLRSRSLWDGLLESPRDNLGPGVVLRHRITGPAGTTLYVVERSVMMSATGRDVPVTVRVTAALDAAEIARATGEFAEEVAVSLLVLAVVLVGAAMAQIFVGLRPLDRVRSNVLDVLAGRRNRVEAEGPSEVMPLVDTLNGLLDAQEKAIGAARQRAADLAHGLKTPLSVLRADAERLRARGETEIADEVAELAILMRRHIGRELSRTRLASSLRRDAATGLRDILERIARTLARGPRGDELVFDIDVPDNVAVAVEPDDLAEVLGALMENAAQWARSRVCVQAEPRGDTVEIKVGDDGPGVSGEALSRLGERGVRLDERVDSHGLGLAIATDIIDAYGGQIRFAVNDGLEVVITLSRADRREAGCSRYLTTDA